MFLKIVRILFIVGGLALLGVGAVMIIGVESSSGGNVSVNWTCEPDPASNNVTRCRTQSGFYTDASKPGAYLAYYLMPISGLGLIGAALALGQFDRPAPPRPQAAVGPPPRVPAAGGPPPGGPPPGAGPQPWQR